MNISLHLVLAVLLIASALFVVTAESSIRRRVRSFRRLQLVTLASALLLVPASIVATVTSTSELFTTWLVALGAAALLVQMALAFASWIPVSQSRQVRRVLAIGAHPDDLELACGGTLARLADAGHEIHALVMSDGAVGGDSAVRPTEAQRGSTFLGLTRCTVVGLPDTLLSSYETEMTREIERRIVSLNPDIILTHSSNDQHQDHTAVHWSTLRAGRRHPAILCYESPSATAAFSPQVFVEVDDYVEAKNAAVSLHVDQFGKPYMTPDAVIAKAVFRGEQAKLSRAEGFEAVRVPAFKGLL